MNEFNFSNNLKYLRQKNSFTQLELAKKLGVTKQSISAYENGKSEPNIFILSKLATIFNCSIDSIIFDENAIDISKFIKINESAENSVKPSSAVDILIKTKDSLITEKYELDMAIKEIDTILLKLKSSNDVEYSNEIGINSDNINFDDYSKSKKTYIDIGFYKENDVQIYYPKESKENTYRIPVVGYISAGCPHWAFENISNHLNISKDYLGCYNKYFILKVAGESMNEIYKNNDYILVDGSQNIVSSNTPVIALVDNDEATVKYIYIDHENNTFTLIPKSSDNTFEPITYSFERHSLKILGTVLGVVNYANSIK